MRGRKEERYKGKKGRKGRYMRGRKEEECKKVGFEMRFVLMSFLTEITCKLSLGTSETRWKDAARGFQGGQKHLIPY